MLFGILLTVQIIICLAMGGLILIQQSEGGALGMGGGPSGFMSARGAGNLLTRMTGILAFLFFANCIALTAVGNMQNRVKSAVDQVDTSGLTLPVSGAATSTAAASSSASSAGPSLSDLPLGAPPPAATQAPLAAAPAGKIAGPTPQLSAPVVLPKTNAASGASQKQVEAAKNAIWDTSSSSKAASGSKTPAATKPAASATSSAAQ
ncbi:MAG: preprotein translocase subunit SecG [Asticcacaulis sp.]|uniref:preprotein translocase subunit SecG n=1 Tax=Asticcacaulis sp. TaxID=1872648 RepID=UPI003F7C98B4